MMIWVHCEMHLLSGSLRSSLLVSAAILEREEEGGRGGDEQEKRHLHLNKQRKAFVWPTKYILHNVVGPPTVITARFQKGKNCSYTQSMLLLCLQTNRRTNKQNETIHCQIEDTDCSNLSLVESSSMHESKGQQQQLKWLLDQGCDCNFSRRRRSLPLVNEPSEWV